MIMNEKFCGGTEFIELQYCKLKIGTPEKNIIKVSSIKHWKSDSLYIHINNIEKFKNLYLEVFGQALYNNMKKGNFDIYGINYFTKEQIKNIIERLNTSQLEQYEILVKWLQKGQEYNGIYLLGI